jgi:photosystem II stability/assembly factor-like uncharacterized protein
MIRQFFLGIALASSLCPTPNLQAQRTDSCLAEINGAKKGEPGNVQDNMFHSLTIDPKNENMVYAGTEANGIFKTTDGGKTWRRLRQGLKCTINQTGYSQIFDIAIDPKHPQIVYAAAVNGPGPVGNVLYPSNSGGVYKSVDGGKTWRQKVRGFTNSYTTYILIDSTNNNRLYAGIGGVKSTFPLTPDIFFEGGILMSADAGESWLPLTLPAGVNTNVFIDMVIRGAEQKIIYASGQLHRQDAPTAYGLIKSSDGGATWSIINPPGTTIYGFDVYKNDSNIIYGHDDSPQRKVYKSLDGGASWAVIPNASFFGTIRIHPNDAQTVFYTGFHTIMKSTNGLHSAVAVYEDASLTSAQQMLDIEISESNPNVVWACAKGYYLYKSTDGGNAFVKITAMRDSVYKNPVAVQEKISGAMPQKFALEQNYPNPFSRGATFSARSGGNPATTIRFYLPQRERVTLKVFDLYGREVATLAEEEFQAGEHAILFDPQNLPGSIYFYSLTAGKFKQTRKAVLLK